MYFEPAEACIKVSTEWKNKGGVSNKEVSKWKHKAGVSVKVASTWPIDVNEAPLCLTGAL